MFKSVTVVSGIPRSGTSLMMNILQEAGLPILSDGKRKPDASNPRGYFELDAVKRSRQETEWLKTAPGTAVKVIHSLLDCLPDRYTYRVVLMHRPIAAVIASQNRMLELQGKQQSGLSEKRLEAILQSQLEESRKLLAEKPHFDWIEIDYPSLIEQPHPNLRTLTGFLGLPLQIERLARCIDPRLQH
jgi:hypothetical protein